MAVPLTIILKGGILWAVFAAAVLWLNYRFHEFLRRINGDVNGD